MKPDKPLQNWFWLKKKKNPMSKFGLWLQQSKWIFFADKSFIFSFSLLTLKFYKYIIIIYLKCKLIFKKLVILNKFEFFLKNRTATVGNSNWPT